MNTRNPLSIFKTLDTLGKEGDMFNSMLDDAFHFYGCSPFKGINNPDFIPSLDFTENSNQYTISVETPGMKKEDIKINISNNIMTIKGEKQSETTNDNDEKYICERRYGSFRREFKLPTDADAEQISAKYEDGVLTLNIQKKQIKEKETRTISIE